MCVRKSWISARFCNSEYPCCETRAIKLRALGGFREGGEERLGCYCLGHPSKLPPCFPTHTSPQHQPSFVYPSSAPASLRLHLLRLALAALFPYLIIWRMQRTAIDDRGRNRGQPMLQVFSAPRPPRVHRGGKNTQYSLRWGVCIAGREAWRRWINRTPVQNPSSKVSRTVR